MDFIQSLFLKISMIFDSRSFIFFHGTNLPKNWTKLVLCSKMPILIKLYNKKKWCYALVLRPFEIMTLDVVDSLRIPWSPILCKVGLLFFNFSPIWCYLSNRFWLVILKNAFFNHRSFSCDSKDYYTLFLKGSGQEFWS